MDHILALQLLQAELDSGEVTTTGYSTCSKGQCSTANLDGFDE